MAKLRDQISSLQDDVSKSSDQVGLRNHVAAFRADCCRVSKFDLIGSVYCDWPKTSLL